MATCISDNGNNLYQHVIHISLGLRNGQKYKRGEGPQALYHLLQKTDLVYKSTYAQHKKPNGKSLCTSMWSQPIGLQLFVNTKEESGSGYTLYLFSLYKLVRVAVQGHWLLWVGTRSQPQGSFTWKSPGEQPGMKIPIRGVWGLSSCISNKALQHCWGCSWHSE